MITYATFRENCQRIEERILAACSAVGREATEVALLPVTKTHPVDVVEYASRYGFTHVGENRVQEAVDKQAFAPAGMKWELIGHLQSNKAKLAAANFSRVQSIDSAKLIQRLDSAAGELGRPLAILLQINAGDDPAKFGVSCGEADALLELALSSQHLRVEGLMTIAPQSDDMAVAAKTFNRLRETRDRLAMQFATSLPVLSMGMTGDLEEAIKAGSTQVRVGSALFGAR